MEEIDLNKTVDKKSYRKAMDEAPQRLGLLQWECEVAGIPVIIVFERMGVAGKGVQINRLTQALDPRGFDVCACGRPTGDEQMRPFLWRYWTKTPARGKIAIFDRSWYRSVQVDRFDGLTPEDKLPDAYQDILSFEKQLSDDGTVIIKLSLYIGKKEQKKRFKKLNRSKETAWRVTREDWERNKEFERYLITNEKMLGNTDTDYAPWSTIEAVDRDYAALKIVTAVMDRLESELEERKAAGEKPVEKTPLKATRGRFKNGILPGTDLSKSLTEEEYKERMKRLQKRLAQLHSELYRLRIPMIIGFEGWDVGDKGGAIKHLTSQLDPRGYRMNSTATPNDVEKVHHYLQRFWNNVPKTGHIAIFDHTWYGRVMVERIEGFCTETQWKRAYQEINETESHMANASTMVLKFWLHIDKDEQERRFKEHQADPLKQWKIADEDWRNREKWDQCEDAVNEVLVRTSTAYAPWIMVGGNDKHYARVKVLQTVMDALEKKIEKVKESR